jgi:hypothetical protein
MPGITRASKTLFGVAALPWNRRQDSRGIGGRLAVESVAAFAWNTQIATLLFFGLMGKILSDSYRTVLYALIIITYLADVKAGYNDFGMRMDPS